MALKALVLKKRLNEKKEQLEELRRAAEQLQTREAELEQSINEAETDEEKAAVEEAVEQFEQEKAENEAAAGKLEGEIKGIETEIEELARNAPKPQNPEKREENFDMETRTFFGLDAQRRDAFLARQDVKDFLTRVRELGKQNRSITGAELTIPDVMLGLIRENISKYSKMISRVNLRSVPGTARQNIMGTVPEAVWTEMCAKLNELELSFNQIEVDGYKVGGFIAICNATLEDSDLSLASEIMEALGQAIGYALDKAILYGTGKKMPIGVVTRLAQATEPDDWGANAPDWKDVHTSNIVKLTAATGADLYKSIILTAGVARSTYARGSLTWVMNETTKAKLTAEALVINAAGAIVSCQGNTMPVLGGDIVTLDFVPDNDVIFGYFDLYLLAQRAGTTLAQSEHVRFIEDQTVFKGTARYDGMPVFGEAFGVLNINNTAPTTSVTFPPDSANP